MTYLHLPLHLAEFLVFFESKRTQRLLKMLPCLSKIVCFPVINFQVGKSIGNGFFLSAKESLFQIPRWRNNGKNIGQCGGIRTRSKDICGNTVRN